MMLIWRVILLVICTFLVVVCFPYYPQSAGMVVLLTFLLFLIIIIIVSAFLRLVMLAKSHVANAVVDVLLMIAYTWVLLFFLPQNDGVTPYEKLRKGEPPTRTDIDIGLMRFGLGTTEEIKTELGQKLEQVTTNVQNMTENLVPPEIVVEEHKD